MILSWEEAKRRYKGAVICEGAVIHEGAVIREGAVIHKGAEICKGAVIREGAVIYKGAEICKGAVIREGARIGVNRKNVEKNFVILGIGNTKNITAFICNDGLIITIGCQNDYKGLLYEEMVIEVEKKYNEEHEYFDALRLIKKWYDNQIKNEK